jgi:hypothetical protein
METRYGELKAVTELSPLNPQDTGSWASTNASQDSLEWLFEVKTSIGPCETDFIMSQAQYDLVSLNLYLHHTTVS